MKFVKVAPRISGSLESAPSMAITAAVPRYPLTFNCCVKFDALLVSVMVAARSCNCPESRLFRGLGFVHQREHVTGRQLEHEQADLDGACSIIEK